MGNGGGSPNFVDLPYDIHLTAIQSGYGVLFQINKKDIPKLKKWIIKWELNKVG